MYLHRVLVPARSGGRRVKAKGFFKGAVVSRGKDWSWDDQDGGSPLCVQYVIYLVLDKYSLSFVLFC